ncbi:MAG: UDP-N-acetylmuramate--L-alanine ligase [Spirochaetaceae bacterium]
MGAPQFPARLENTSFFMVGIKGTGMEALTEVLVRGGARVAGSDTEEVFYTDAVLEGLGIPVYTGFDAETLPADADVVVHSAAYDRERNPQLVAARQRGLPIFTYTEALGEISRGTWSVGVAGVHGKTTTTAMIGTMVKGLGLPGTVLVGSAVANFSGMSTYSAGRAFFVAETCEYRRHFLDFHPDIIVLTSVEPDHLDYYRDYADIRDAFVSFAERLPEGGELIYSADNAGAVEVSDIIAARRPDIRRTPYGRRADGPFGLRSVATHPGRTTFRPAGAAADFTLRLPGEHNAENAVAALCVISRLADRTDTAESGGEHGRGPEGRIPEGRIPEGAGAALEAFSGTRRRSEIIGEARGVLFLDDYGHHPTAIRTTLSGLREFYPGRRLVVDFMSHTYSRTAALLDEFATCFGEADEVILHEIYASAREQFDGSIRGEDLARAVAEQHGKVRFIEKVEGAEEFLKGRLRPGDLFVTMGAGNNWVLSHRLYEEFSKERIET